MADAFRMARAHVASDTCRFSGIHWVQLHIEEAWPGGSTVSFGRKPRFVLDTKLVSRDDRLLPPFLQGLYSELGLFEHRFAFWLKVASLI